MNCYSIGNWLHCCRFHRRATATRRCRREAARDNSAATQQAVDIWCGLHWSQETWNNTSSKSWWTRNCTFPPCYRLNWSGRLDIVLTWHERYFILTEKHSACRQGNIFINWNVDVCRYNYTIVIVIFSKIVFHKMCGVYRFW